MQNLFNSERLSISPLTTNDTSFIRALVNTEGWIRFIGERNVHSDKDADAYITKILNNPNVTYWVVRLRNSTEALGIITLIRRDYLEHHDIGFAFLPEHAGKGYAYEASIAVMNSIIQGGMHTHILATTIPSNSSSVQLLKKLGLQFEKEITVENETLHLFSVTVDELKRRLNSSLL